MKRRTQKKRLGRMARGTRIYFRHFIPGRHDWAMRAVILYRDTDSILMNLSSYVPLLPFFNCYVKAFPKFYDLVSAYSKVAP